MSRAVGDSYAIVTRLLDVVLPPSDGAIATEDQLEALLASVVARVVAASDRTRSDPPTGLEEAVDVAVWLLARDGGGTGAAGAGGAGARGAKRN
jgi:hypothetical protein